MVFRSHSCNLKRGSEVMVIFAVTNRTAEARVAAVRASRDHNMSLFFTLPRATFVADHPYTNDAYFNFLVRYLNTTISSMTSLDTVSGYVINDGAFLFDFASNSSDARLKLLSQQADVIKRLKKTSLLLTHVDLRKVRNRTVTSHVDGLKTIAKMRKVDVISVSEVCDVTTNRFCTFSVLPSLTYAGSRRRY